MIHSSWKKVYRGVRAHRWVEGVGEQGEDLDRQVDETTQVGLR